MLSKLIYSFVLMCLGATSASAQCWVYGNTSKSCAEKATEGSWAPQSCHGCSSSDPESVPIVDRNWICTHPTMQSLDNHDATHWNQQRYTTVTFGTSQGYSDKLDGDYKCGEWEDCSNECEVTLVGSAIHINCVSVTGGTLDYYVPILVGSCVYDP
jgi:hypothetical protein